MFDRDLSAAAIDDNGRDDKQDLEPKRLAFQPSCTASLQSKSFNKKIINFSERRGRLISRGCLRLMDGNV